MAHIPFLARLRIVPLILSLSKDERGVTIIELGLILVLISLACMIAFASLGLELTDIFTTATNAMAAA